MAVGGWRILGGGVMWPARLTEYVIFQYVRHSQREDLHAGIADHRGLAIIRT